MPTMLLQRKTENIFVAKPGYKNKMRSTDRKVAGKSVREARGEKRKK
tara:strand:+ start:148 stop:288 length:141 start_codon:yes stop_codon:yes gene_type:complete